VPYLSPRTVVKLHDFSRAAAALMGRRKVTPEDHRAIGYGLVVVGDGSGDMELWHTLCDEFLPWGSTGLRSLEELGKMADTIGQIKSEGPMATPLQIKIGGQMVPATSMHMRRFVDALRGNRHPVLQLARASLLSEVNDLDRTRPHHFNLHEGW
jgi:hypothetical protein